MRKTMPRKRALVAAGNEAADKFVMQIGKCEFCQRSRDDLIQHEIANAADRTKARVEPPYAVIVVCSPCHRTLHRMAKEDAVAAGLAIIKRERLEDYNLKAFWDMTARRFPDVETIELWSRRIAQ